VAYPRMSFGSPGIVLGDLQRGAPNRARTGDTGIPLVESLACYLFRVVYYSKPRESTPERTYFAWLRFSQGHQRMKEATGNISVGKSVAHQRSAP